MSDEVKRGRGRPKSSIYPYELVCTVTGNKVKTNPVQLRKLIESTGRTLDDIVSNYVSREGKRILKDKKGGKRASTPAPVTNSPSVPAVEHHMPQVPASEAVEDVPSVSGPIEDRISPERLQTLRKNFPPVA